MVTPEQWIADEIKNNIGIRQTMRLTSMSQHTIEKIVDRENVRRATYNHMVKIINVYRSRSKTGEIGTTAKA